jgi:hypothetical protein
MAGGHLGLSVDDFVIVFGCGASEKFGDGIRKLSVIVVVP